VSATLLDQKPDTSRVRSAVDLVPLGDGGPLICRLGIGTGSEGGEVQRGLGADGFNWLIRHAYDRGITFIDTADQYRTHTLVRDAIKGLLRERLWIQTKMMWDAPAPPDRPLDVLDRFLLELGTDYVDSLLIHCVTAADWPETLRPMMDAISAARALGRVRLVGVSCHGLPALRSAVTCRWIDVQLARVNPIGRHVDGASGAWDEPGMVPEAMREIEAARRTGRGLIAMKLIGGGHFTDSADRERAMRYALACGFVDSMVVAFKSGAEIDETLGRIDRILAEQPS